MRDRLALRFQVPRPKLVQITGVENQLQARFEPLEVRLSAEDEAISEHDYQDKIEEAFRQLGVEVQEE